MTDIPT